MPRTIPFARAVRRRTAALALAAPLVLTGCGGSEDDDPVEEAPPADGTVVGCRGTYAGDFSGGLSGTLTASLDESGNLSISAITSETGDADAGAGVIQPGREFVFPVGPYQIRGTFDLTACAVSGTWAAGFERGSWSLARTGG